MEIKITPKIDTNISVKRTPKLTPAKPPGYTTYGVNMSQCHIPTSHHTMSICHNVTYQHVETSGFTRVFGCKYVPMSHIDIFCPRFQLHCEPVIVNL